MAIGPTLVPGHDTKCKVYKWTDVVTSDTCSPVKIPYFDDMTIYVHGVANNETVALHGSPEAAYGSPSLFAPLKSGGTAISLTDTTTINKCALVDENALWYKPVIGSAGDGSTLMSIWLVVK